MEKYFWHYPSPSSYFDYILDAWASASIVQSSVNKHFIIDSETKLEPKYHHAAAVSAGYSSLESLLDYVSHAEKALFAYTISIQQSYLSGIRNTSDT
jgi:hypothetical protein